MSAHRIQLCHFRSEPGEHECWEAIWSVGRACRRCFVETCYRQGWNKAEVDRDNARLVAEKTGDYEP